MTVAELIEELRALPGDQGLCRIVMSIDTTEVEDGSVSDEIAEVVLSHGVVYLRSY